MAFATRMPNVRLPRAWPLLLAAMVCLHCGGDPIEEARALQEAGRHAEALEILRPLIDGQSRDPEALFLYGANLWRSGRPGLGFSALQEASQSEGWEVTAGLELATAARYAQAWPTAIEAASAVLELEPDNLYARVLRAEARMNARTDHEGALDDLDRAIELEPDNVALRLGRVANLLILKRVEEAGEVIRGIEALATPVDFSIAEMAGFCVARATFERESGLAEEADAAFEDCLERYPEDPQVVLAAVEHVDALGERERGNEILAALVAAQPLAPGPRAQLALRLYAAGESARAEALLYAGGEAEDPFSAAYALSTLAQLYVDDRRFAEAAEIFGRVRLLEGDIGPQRILAHAELLAAAGDNEGALKVAAELGDHFYRHLVYAWVSFNQRNAAEALEHLDTALVQWPDNAPAQFYAGRAAERIGDFPRAVDAYRNSIRAGAGETDAGVKLAQLHMAAGRYEEANVALTHHLSEHPGDVDAALLAVALATELGPASLRASINAVPGDLAWGRVAVVLADVAAKRGGAEAAIEVLRADPRIDLTHPRDGVAIEALVGYLKQADRGAEALGIAEQLIARHPGEARLHWILSRASDGEASSEALERALALDPTLEAAAVERARRLASAGNVDAALALLDGFIPASRELLLDASALLAHAGRPVEAEKRLEDLLWERPHHAAAARELVLLRLSRQVGNELRTLELAERAVRFGGGAEAYDVLARVLEARGELERADDVREKALEAT